MKNKTLSILFFALIAILLAGCASAQTAVPTALPTDTAAPTPVPPTPTSDLPSAVGKLHWFGVSSILYHGSKNIYFDPYILSGNLPTADLILISHAHSDHADLESLKQIIGPHTTLIISPNVTAFYELNKAELGVPATVLAEGETVQVGEIVVKAYPAYDSSFHPRSAGGMGYVVIVDGERIYFAGGTNFYPEMSQIESDVTVYPMYAKDDVEKVIEVLPTKVMIPVHTSGPGAKAYEALFSKLPTKMKFVALDAGPYNP
jgi:L-ascorbate metabolism protein UlaG (beta-lactamase superfamily)